MPVHHTPIHICSLGVLFSMSAMILVPGTLGRLGVVGLSVHLLIEAIFLPSLLVSVSWDEQ